MLLNQSTFNKTLVSTAVLGLVMTAGLPAAYAGPDKGTKQTTKHSDRDQDNQLLHFTSTSELVGSELRNETAESIGTVDDLIVDRGSGKIAYIVVRSGDVLGLGGKQFAIPYSELRYLAPTHSFQTDMTTEQVERQTEFLPDEWSSLTQTSWMDEVASWFSNDNENVNTLSHTEESVRQAVRDGERVRVEGRITSVDRKSIAGEEHVLVTMEDEEGSEQHVVLGPSWYVLGNENQVRNGDEIELNVVKHDRYWVALNSESGSTNIDFRDDDGNPVWETAENRSKRYFLLTDLTGRNTELVGSTVGEVQTSIIEGGSGYVAMIALDPNENLFGLGDEISLVPWAAVSVMSDLTVMVNANETEIERSTKMPDDLDSLRTRSSVAQAYYAFDLDIPKFKQEHRDGNQEAMRELRSKTGDAWAGNGEVTKVFASGEKVEMQGKYRGMTTVSIENGVPDATVLLIDTEDGRKKVIVGPDWFTKRQNIDLSSGDDITVIGRRAEYKGSDWTAAWRISSNENEWSLWNGSRPAWSN